MNFFYEIFDASLPRLGPGDNGSTKSALDLLFGDGAPSASLKHDSRLRILDLGCGNGPQTIELAKELKGKITAVDNYAPYLAELEDRAEAAGLVGRIETLEKDMGQLEFKSEAFDLIWSEGALYSIGFGKGLAVCHNLLIDGGLLAVSELTWLKADRPKECTDYFASEYPAMKDRESNLKLIRESGFDILDYFVLPESAWLASYYLPLEKRLIQFRKKYADDKSRLEIIGSVQAEIDLYRNCSDYYGYLFYLMKRC